MVQAIKLNKLEQGDGKPHVDTSGASGEAAVKMLEADPSFKRFVRHKKDG